MCRRPPRPTHVVHAVAVLALLGLTAVGGPPAAGAAGATGPDIDGDGYGDLVIGAPGEEFGDAIGAGAITVLYGSPAGPGGGGTALLHQGSGGVPGANETRDHWGAVTAVGDFDGDGYDDVAIGAPGEDIGGAEDTGAVTVLYGSAGGLSAAGAEGFNQGSPGVAGARESGDQWGAVLATGDFDGDGYDDLAVGAPGEAIGSALAAGAVTVLYGSASGLDSTTADGLHQDTAGMRGVSEPGDAWGASLAAADVDGDGDDDLVVGAPGEDLGSITDAGAIVVVPGSPSGLDGRGSVALHQGGAMPGAPEPGDGWGSTLVSGDFDGDGYGDVVVGVPGEDLGAIADAGTVAVLYGGTGGLSDASAGTLHQSTPGVPGGSEVGDRFGSVLAAGDVDGDGRDDLAVGAPEEAIGAVLRAGAVTVVPGGPSGLTGAGARFFSQATPGVPGAAEAADHFADGLAVVDLDGDGRGDVAVAAAAESIGSDFDTGYIVVLPGSSRGVGSSGAIGLHQALDAVAGDAETIDYWGRLGSGSRLDLERPAEALITPTGVAVTVLADIPGGAIVRTPCGGAAEVFGGRRLRDVEVVIDPGHGGWLDPGSVAQGLVERDVNQEIAEAVIDQLEARGISAMPTRTGNYLVPLSIRGALADHVRAGAMVSIHHNAPSSAPSPDPGTEAYVQTDSSLSRTLGGLVYERVYDRLDQYNVAWTSRFDAGVMRVLNSRGTDAYGMMARPKTPTTLVELTYMANASEANLIRSSSYTPAMATAIADGIEDFLAEHDPSSAVYRSPRTFDPSFAPGFDVCADPPLQ